MEPREEREHKLRAWAARNAYTIVFLLLMFTITWIILVVNEIHN